MPRVLLLLPTTTYRTKAFIEAGLNLGVDIVAASEMASTMASGAPANIIKLELFDPQKAAAQAVEFHAHHPIDALIPVDEDTAVAAAWIARAIGLDHNSVEAATTAKNKFMMREALRKAGLTVPNYWDFSVDEDKSTLAQRVTYPCVVKPVFLSTSRGVMRANDEQEFVTAVNRLARILDNPKLAKKGGSVRREAIAEEFIPGFEVALEGLLTDGCLRVLALFDKPDPLDGPFFEETIYVTPSRLLEEVQRRIAEEAEAAARAIGLQRGPIHAELRINEVGPWVIEVAARSIGGLCSAALRFGENTSLEELILMHSLGMDTSTLERERSASGVMMIPIPRAGILKGVNGLKESRAVRNVEDVIITAHITQEIVPPPEGGSYLGFIFARGGTAADVEAAIREAHRRLEFVITPSRLAATSEQSATKNDDAHGEIND